MSTIHEPSQFVLSSLIFLFFDLCYETGGSNVGISHLLCTYVYGNSYDFHHSQKGKKTFNNSPCGMEANHMIFFESSVI